MITTINKTNLHSVPMPTIVVATFAVAVVVVRLDFVVPEEVLHQRVIHTINVVVAADGEVATTDHAVEEMC